jgi:hypothetical protein
MNLLEKITCLALEETRRRVASSSSLTVDHSCPAISTSPPMGHGNLRHPALPRRHRQHRVIGYLKAGKRAHSEQGRLTEKIYRNLYGVGKAVDIMVATPEQVGQHQETHWLANWPAALREGGKVYNS